MTDFPNMCTHPDTWACKLDESGTCKTDAEFAKWVEHSVVTESAGTGTYFNPDPHLVGDLDTTLDDTKKLPLGVTGNSEEVRLPEDLQNLNDELPPNQDALNEWRERKKRS